MQITLPYPPSGNHTTIHFGRRGHVKSVKAVRYVDAVKCICREQGFVGFVGPFSAKYLFTAPDNRARDSDNVLKSLRDALTHAGVWEDDRWQIVRREVIEWADEPCAPGKVVLTLEPYVAMPAIQCELMNDGRV